MRTMQTGNPSFLKKWPGMIFIAIILIFSLNHEATANGSNYKRIVAIGGSVTEIVYALGEQDRLIARDTTSVYPQEAFSLPDVGYIRRLSPEGVLSVSPDLILALEGSGPPEAIETLKAANVPIVFVPEGYTAEAIKEKVTFIGRAIGASENASALKKKIDEEIELVRNQIDTARHPKKSIVYSIPAGWKGFGIRQKYCRKWDHRLGRCKQCNFRI